MRGYLLILTSGILFFIIAVVTVLHLMSAKTLNQQYRINGSYQDILNQMSIQSIVSFFIDNNIEHIQLPMILSNEYDLTNQIKSDGSVDFYIQNNLSNRITTFNVVKASTQSGFSTFNSSNISVSNGVVSGVQITSSIPTHLVSLATVWYPYQPMDLLTHYSFVDSDGDEEFVTANVSMGEDFLFGAPRSSSNRFMNLYFSNLSEGGAISIYLKYSDGSIQNAHIEY